MMNQKKGVLYGIGVGPGDPELITIKAVNTLRKVDVIFTASSTKNSFSLAITVCRPYIAEHIPVISLSFPMTSDREEAGNAWRENAETILAVLEEGKNAAFLTLGDPMTYSTFGYILSSLNRMPVSVSVEVIPGVTSYQAAAARIKRPLVEGEESLLITSGAYGGDNLRRLAECAENIVLLKAYKNVEDIASALKHAGLLEKSIAVSNCGRENETITRNLGDLSERKPDYWTLILTKK
jgi:precorrin-2/cobalt-factor-2 C20-methyltransferase